MGTQQTESVVHTRPVIWWPGFVTHLFMSLVQKPDRHFSHTILFGTQQTLPSAQKPAMTFVVCSQSAVGRHVPPRVTHQSWLPPSVGACAAEKVTRTYDVGTVVA